jgi:hypothetical protein
MKAPVLFLVWKRPDITRRVFEAIRRAQPPKLYVAADGPRKDKLGEAERCADVRCIATAVDWPCEVKTLFREKNLGCKRAVSDAITWFFEYEEQGIILEDDCLPHPDFFHFCDVLLEYYASDERVFVITGNNFQDGQKRGNASYYFSKYNHCWGWASWRRAWKHYQEDIPFYPNWVASPEWFAVNPDPVERYYWSKIFESFCAGKIDTWDYPWTASVWYQNGLTATPNVNLVSNIGFGADATHTKRAKSPLANKQTFELGKLVHTDGVHQDTEADRYVFEHVFGGRFMRFPWSMLYLPRRIAGSIYRRLQGSVA